MENKAEGKMYIGLDMGTSSVGWAVTNEKYELLRAKGKDLWGARLFDEAKTKAERRSKRAARRRLRRRRVRIGLLQEYFADEIMAVDPSFYQRLKESKFYQEDRSDWNHQPNALFNDANYKDANYFEDYPTIFHLRAELLKPWEGKKDIRLLYLAIENMFKHRGNFLNTSLNSDDEGAGDMPALWQAFREKAEEYNIYFDADINPTDVEDIIAKKGSSRSHKLEELACLFSVKKSSKNVVELLKLICGIKAKIDVIFDKKLVDDSNKGLTLGFRESSFEEDEEKVRSILGDDDYELISAAKAIHDLGLLSNILKGSVYLSDARVAAYYEHKEDLTLLKSVLKRYDHAAYHKMFQIMQPGNYSAYVGSVNHKDKKNAAREDYIIRRNNGDGRSREDLYTYIKNTLKQYPQDDPDIVTILNRISNETFLNKQLTGFNGVIPNQLLVRELRKILENAEVFYPFLKEVDESNLTVSQRIIELFRFRMPYYVGPQGSIGDDVWAVHKEEGRVLPWNLNQKIDLSQTRIEFIKRMVRHCTYLRDENTLPKCSLLYEKFMVLDELNLLKVHDEPISVEIKQDIYSALFMRGKKVTIRQLEDYFRQHGVVDKNEKDFLSGIDTEGGFKASLNSYGKFRAIFGKESLSDEEASIAEQIIFWKTIYSDDNKAVRECIQEKYPDVFTAAQIKRILSLKMSDWGKLSREFLELQGTSNKDGETRPLLRALWETNDNLSILLSDRYTYRNELNKRIKIEEKSLSDWEFSDLEGLYLSTPVKRMIWQTMKIMNELVEITGRIPDRIFVEMSRDDGEKGVRKDSRKAKLLESYKNLTKDYKDLLAEINSREEPEFRNKKLYLYFLQLGKCMYTGEHIDLHALLSGNTTYDIDHIYPRRLIKDDSIENNLVLVKKEFNSGKKGGDYPIDRGTQQRMRSHWKRLLDYKLITQEKYDRLVHTEPLTDYERAEFINRQLVETRQGTKAITQILQEAFPKTEIVFSKAGVVSDFRKQFDMIKVRCVNNFHHAEDAYLNIVVGNVYRTKFTGNPLNFIREADKHGNKGAYQYHMNEIFKHDVIRGKESAWVMPKDGFVGTIAVVRRTMNRNTPLITRRTYNYAKGRNVTNKDTIYSKDRAKAGVYLGLSTHDSRLANVKKYGGRSDISSMCYCLVEYKVKGKNVRSLEALPVYLGDISNLSEGVITEYILNSLQVQKNKKQVTDFHILIKDVRFKSRVKIDGFFYYLAGKSEDDIELDGAVELKLDKSQKEYLRKIEKAIATGFYCEKDRNSELILSKEKNQVLYRELIKKQTSSIYKHRKKNIAEVMEEGATKFASCSIEQQCQLLFNIVQWMAGSKRLVDLTLIGGNKKNGRARVRKNVFSSEEFILISNSVTGIYAREIDLLKI